MARWLRDVSTEWAGSVLAWGTAVIIGLLIATAYWAWTSASGPTRATIILVLSVIFVVVLLQLWWFRSGKRRIAEKASLERTRELNERHREALANLDKQTQEKLNAQVLIAREREEIIKESMPKIGWADSLIERERGDVWLYVDVKYELWKDGHLDDAEPYFEIWLPFDYTGAMQLIIGETISGHLEWEGSPLSREPMVSGDANLTAPFVATGPTRGCLRLRQYVTTEARAKQIKEYLAKGVIEMEFWSRNFNVSIRKKSFDGEVVAEGHLIGDYLPASTRGS